MSDADASVSKINSDVSKAGPHVSKTGAPVPETDAPVSKTDASVSGTGASASVLLAENGRTLHIDTYYSSLPQLLHLYDRCGRAHAFHGSTADEWQAWQADARMRLIDLLGLTLLEPCDPVGRVTERVEIPGESIVRERHLIQVQPDEWMPTYVLIPNKPLRAADGRPRCVVCPHAHQSAGKLTVAGARGIGAVDDAIEKFHDDYGLQLARRGYVAVCPDARGSGERRDKALQGDEETRFMRCSDAQLAHMAEPLGLSVAGLFTWDLQRCLDYIEASGIASMSHLGCVGFSGGGMQTLWLAALDERVAWAVISGYLYGVRDSLLELNNNCSCNYVPGLWRSYDMGDVASLIAPRPLVVQSCIDDHLNGRRGMANADEQVAVARTAYTLLGASDAMRHDHHPGPHHFCDDLLDDELAWVNFQLHDSMKG